MKQAAMMGLAVLGLLLGGLQQVKADYSIVTWTGSGPGAQGDGPVSAQAVFKAIAGVGIEISVTNLQTNENSIGQAVSQIQFQFGGALAGAFGGTPFTELQGTDTSNFSSYKSDDFLGQSNIENQTNWAFAKNGPIATFATAGSPASGQPIYLIAANGAPNGAGFGSHAPSFVSSLPSTSPGAVNFFLADPSLATNSLTLRDILSVNFAFGTSPDSRSTDNTGTVTVVPSGATPATAVTPEPASFTLLGIGAVAMLGYSWKRRRRSAAPAA
jgi:hypothetical protein